MSARRYPQRPGGAPACEIASVVAINVFGTVTAMSPSPMPAAISANRSASVPLPTPIHWDTSQNAANSRSNASTIGPPINPAVSRAELKTPSNSSRSSLCGVTRSKNGILFVSTHTLNTPFSAIRKTRAGFPATIAFEGTLLVTTLPAPPWRSRRP